MRTDIGIGGFATTNQPEHTLKTYALGSCIAVVLISHMPAVVGMIHIALPDSRGHDEKARRTPGYFADTGLKRLWDDMQKQGARRGGVTAKMTGGASVLDESGVFDIGRRNVLAAKKWLWSQGIGLMKEETGGSISRTVEVHLDGKLTVASGGTTKEL